MSAAAVATKTPAATVMAGEKTNNNQLKAACRRGHAATKLLPPSCRRCRQAARHCRTAAAATALPLLPLRQCCHQAASAPALLPPSCHRRCQAAHHRRAAAATAALPLPPLRCCCCRRAAAALPKALPPPPKLRFRQATISAAKLAATAKLPPLLPPTLLRCRTAAAPPQLPRCRRLRCYAAAATTTAVLPCCPPPPCFCHHWHAADANARLASTMPVPLFSLLLSLLSLSPFPSLLLMLLLVDCFFCPRHCY